MVETKREDLEELKRIIFENCDLIHPGVVLPDSPWFTRSSLNQQVTENLLKLLADSKKKTKTFSKNAAKFIISKKDEKENNQIKRASILRENIDILNLLEKVQKVEDSSTQVTLKVLKSQSDFGPVTVHVNSASPPITLEEGDEGSLKFDFKGTIDLKLTVGQDRSIVKQVKFIDIINVTHYLKAAEKDLLSETVSEKSNGFSVDLQVAIRLSKQDKEKLLKDHLRKVEEQLKENQQEFEEFYEELLKALYVEYDYDDGMFKTTYKKKDKSNRFCDNCSLF
ncbi:unnamed protein product [Blepharisma stoltei]|uniref:Uncharacterized protein n=1 Tax=Blepharisma stoltei TaxID=1481888 RepID=A0AAU9IU33_9CILI|nr:unnamed protein product [Blepharisma stoltei]